MHQVNDENETEAETVVLEIVTTTRIEVPKGSMILNAFRDDQQAGIILPSGEELKSYIVFESNEKELNYPEMENLGCHYEDISRTIKKV